LFCETSDAKTQEDTILKDDDDV